MSSRNCRYGCCNKGHKDHGKYSELQIQQLQSFLMSPFQILILNGFQNLIHKDNVFPIEMDISVNNIVKLSEFIDYNEAKKEEWTIIEEEHAA